MLYIARDISPVVEGLRMTGGDADGLSGSQWGDAGGGVYLSYSAATLSGNTIFSNTADQNGGGAYLFGSAATLNGNTVSANTANESGGGLYLNYSDATLDGNTVNGNTANSPGELYGGGGLYLWFSDTTLSGNTVASNSANTNGGGLYLRDSEVTLSGNIIVSNTANQNGGGVYDSGASSTLNGNIISGNTARHDCGGLAVGNATLINNVVADNQASNTGSGLCLGSSSRLLHTTIARNDGGDSSGVYVAGFGVNVALTNTILVSHSIGIYVEGGNTARLEGTLWGSGGWANTTDWGGDGTIITGTVNIWDDPLFMDSDNGDYHLSPGSPAIDAGVDAGVTEDIDGETRPADDGYDIGADEALHRVYLPLMLRRFP